MPGDSIFSRSLGDLENIAPIPDWRKGEPLTADRLSEPGRAINRMVSGASAPRQLGMRPAADGGALAMFRVSFNRGDYLIAKRTDGIQSSGESINIAKRWDLRRTPFDGKFVDGITYAYESDDERIATRKPISERQFITPTYFNGAIIWATKAETGLVEVDGELSSLEWLAVVDGRDWAWDGSEA